MYNKNERLNRIRNSLKKIGYTEEYQEENYPFTSGNLALKADIVTFNDSIIHDISTSNISVILEENSDAYDKVGISMGTPIIIKANNNNVQIENITTQEPDKIITLKYEDIDSYFAKSRIDFDLINEYKNDKAPKQLSLFELSIDVNSKIIEKEFTNMLRKGKILLKEKEKTTDQDYKDLVSICMNIIAAVIIEHKLNSKNVGHDIVTMLDKYANKYHDYFKNEIIYKYGKQFVIDLYEELDKDISYKNINSNILSTFYEDSLFTDDKNAVKEIKRELGNYYTPRILAEDMINAIPVELIPEEKRFTLDGTCGCGSLLHQAYYRLKNLLPKKMDNKEKHKYLTKMIEGIDIDVFAKELTKLSFLLISLPFGNGWKIFSTDMLKVNNFKDKPSIILANPPFGANSHKPQKAIEFCDAYIDILNDDGYMAIVLPQSILTIKAASNLRKRILDELNILEIWTFPGGVFKNNCPTIVMILNKSNRKLNRPIIVKTVSRENREDYLLKHSYTEEYIISNYETWKDNKENKFEISPLYNICNKIEINKKLENYTNIFDGIILNIEKNKNKISKIYKEDFVPFVPNANNMVAYKQIDNFLYLKYDEKIKYEGENRLRFQSKALFESEKVLVKRSSTAEDKKCLIANIDRKGLFVKNSFCSVVPKDKEELSLEEIVALLNSDIINAYARMKDKKRTLDIKTIKKIPVPKFTENDKEKIIEIVHSLERDNNDYGKITILNSIINDAFKLNDVEKAILEKYWKNESKINSDNSDLKNKWNLTGFVKEINNQRLEMKVEFYSLDIIKTIKIEGYMPGWLLEEGTEFSCAISNEDIQNIKEKEIHLYNIMPIKYSYMSLEDLHAIHDKFITKEAENE